jgi:phospholipid/cholesterol/gamma-HCH transport system substrate-binding protein
MTVYRPWEMALGALVLVAGVAFAVFGLATTGTRLAAAPGYTLTAEFRSAEGVRPGTEVRLAGVRVGSVTGMVLDPDTFSARVTLRVDRGLNLPEDSTLAVSSEGLLGGTFLEILPGGAPFDLEPGGRFADTQSAVSLIALLLRAFTAETGAAEGPAGGAPAEPGE